MKASQKYATINIAMLHKIYLRVWCFWDMGVSEL